MPPSWTRAALRTLTGRSLAALGILVLGWVCLIAEPASRAAADTVAPGSYLISSTPHPGPVLPAPDDDRWEPTPYDTAFAPRLDFAALNEPGAALHLFPTIEDAPAPEPPYRARRAERGPPAARLHS